LGEGVSLKWKPTWRGPLGEGKEERIDETFLACQSKKEGAVVKRKSLLLLYFMMPALDGPWRKEG